MSVLFNDTATLYMMHINPSTRRETYTRLVCAGVQWKQNTQRSVGGDGILNVADYTTVTFPDNVNVGGRTYVNINEYKANQTGNWTLSDGFILVYGNCDKEITSVYTVADLKKDFPSYCTIESVSDNTNKPLLKHRRVTAV